MDILSSIQVSAGGMLAESQRMRVAAENIANADSVQGADGNGPYRAKQVFFRSALNRATGATEVKSSIKTDTTSPLRAQYEPANPLADARGFVQYPNVDTTIETLNMKEAQRSYEANMAAITTAQDMAGRTLDMLR